MREEDNKAAGTVQSLSQCVFWGGKRVQKEVYSVIVPVLSGEQGPWTTRRGVRCSMVTVWEGEGGK